MSEQTLGAMAEFYRARLVALDNWAGVQSAMRSQGDRVAAIARELGVTDLGALSVLAIADRAPPDRANIESQLRSIEYLQRLLERRR